MPLPTGSVRRALRPLVSALVAVLLAAGPARGQDIVEVPFLATAPGIVTSMLELADVSADDVVYDLGSGDGRIPIIAAAQYGARSVGVEIRRDLVIESRANAERARVEDRVRFVHGDLFDTDLSPATVVTLYLLPDVNRRLAPKLLRELRPGARIVANRYPIPDWTPDERLEGDEERPDLLLWRVPANVQGRWRIDRPQGGSVTLDVDQRFQEVRAEVLEGNVRVEDVDLQGSRLELSLSADDTDEPVHHGGTVSGDEIRGTTDEQQSWSARRITGDDGSLVDWNTGGR